MIATKIKFKKVCSGFYKSECGTVEISKLDENKGWTIEKYNSSNSVEWYETFQTKGQCIDYANKG